MDHSKHGHAADPNALADSELQAPVTRAQLAAQENLFRELMRTQEENLYKYLWTVQTSVWIIS